MVEIDPIRCWWRTSTGAVRIGETFTLALTCAVLETEAVQVVPDESRLGVGRHSAGALRGRRRRATRRICAAARGGSSSTTTSLRIINPDAIGKDVCLPDLSIRLPRQQPARRQRRAAGPRADLHAAAAVGPGRCRWCPRCARHSRLGGASTSRRLESLALPGQRCSESCGWRVHGARRPDDAARARRAGAPVHAEGHGWRAAAERRRHRFGRRSASSPPSSARPSAGLDRRAGRSRAGGVRASRPLARSAVVHQTTAARGATPPEAGEGRLIAHGRLPRSRTTTLSASTTPGDLARQLARLPASAPAGRRQQLDEMRGALATFSSALYGPAASLDRSALDQAIASAIVLARAARSELNSPLRLARNWMARAQESEQPAEP